MEFCYVEDNADFSLQNLVVNWEVQRVGDQVPQKAFGKSRSDGVAEGELFLKVMHLYLFPSTI